MLENKHLETELEITQASLKTKEMEVLAEQRALTMKEEEHKRVHDRPAERERIQRNEGQNDARCY